MVPGPTCQSAPIGGSRAGTATSDRHAARLAFRSASALPVNSGRIPAVYPSVAVIRESVRTVGAPTPARTAGVLFQGVQELAAGLLAASTGLFADPAVLVVPGMPLALVATARADG